MKRTILSAAFIGLATFGMAQSNVIFWDFNSPTDDASTATGVTTPVSGTGTISNIGGVTNTFATGNNNDPNATDNSGYQSTGYPAQGTTPKTAGVELAVNTTGFNNLVFEFYQRLSNAAANTWVVQYTEDITAGTVVWVDVQTFTFEPQDTGTGDTWYFRSVDLTAFTGLNNNPLAGFRIVSDFDPILGEYDAARLSSAYSGGTSRFDLVRIYEAYPEASIAAASNFVAVDENVGTVQVPVTITGGNGAPSKVVFGYSVYSNATEGADFTVVNDTLDVPAGTNGIVNFPVTIIDDVDAERAERVIVKIVGGINIDVAPTNHYQIIYIKDNDYVAPSATNELNLSLLTSFSNGATGSNSAEIVAYDSTTYRLYIANSVGAKLDIIDFSNPASPTLINSVDVTSYGNINSVTVYDGTVAMAIENTDAQLDGFVVFLDQDGTFISQVTVGAMPDMITFTHDHTKVLTANEGEPNSDYSSDPEGSVSIVDLTAGYAALTNADVTTIGFTAYNGMESQLLAQGLRIFSTSASVAQDLEPEYIAISTDDQKAFVSLQENNGMLVIDIPTATIDTIYALGYIDYSSDSWLDPSDQSGSVLIGSAPVKGAYMPDAVAYASIGGQGYVFSANEGDSREFGSVVDAERIQDLDLDPVVFPEQHILKNKKLFGRLNGLQYSGNTDADPELEEIHVLGGRSFSIWDAATGQLVYNSGDILEQVTAAHPVYGEFFNASNSEGSATLKNRSDDKGPEVEGVTTAEIDGNHYVFASMERIGGVSVFNVNNPAAPEYVTYVNNRTLAGSGPDLGAEGIIYISAAASPNGESLVILANEVSSTLSVYQINTCAELAGAELVANQTTICTGDTALISFDPEATTTFTWMVDNSPISGATNDTLVAQDAGTYTLHVQNTTYACEATSNAIEVLVNALPIVEANATVTTLCEGDSVTLTGAGADTYSWDNGVTDNDGFAPPATTTYEVTGTDANGCSNTASVEVIVNELPTVVANVSSTAVCEGESLTLSGSGADSYAWDNSVTDGVAFVPTLTATYEVIGTDANGCIDTATVDVAVNALPVVDLGADSTLCENHLPYTIDAGNFASYDWSSGETTQSITVTSEGTYSVTVTNAEGCTATDAIEIMTDPCAGVEELEIVTAIYPNPTNAFVTIEFADFTQAEITVADMHGKVMSQATANGTYVNIDMSSLVEGMYFVQVNGAGLSNTYRIVKK